MKCFLKYLLIVLSLATSSVSKSYAQDFYKDYRAFLISNYNKKITKQQKTLIDSAIKRLQLTIHLNENKNRKSFFTTDTIFIVSFTEAETSFPSAIIWNRNVSCYYHYSYSMVHWKKFNQKLDVKPDASDILKSFNYNFRKVIETGDTSGYHKYADAHRVFDAEWVSPIIAVKTNNHWQFIILKGNGSAINYYPDLQKNK